MIEGTDVKINDRQYAYMAALVQGIPPTIKLTTDELDELVAVGYLRRDDGVVGLTSTGRAQLC